MAYILIGGFCMALADSVPGVSGGTIAFIMGFYDNLINSLTALIHGTKENKLKALSFLIKLGIGWIIGMGLAVTLLASVFTTGIYQVSSLFLGFVLASIPLILVEERNSLKGGKQSLLFILLGTAVVVALSIFNFSSAVHNLGFNALTAVYVFATGMLAICAMILPGISGSTLLMTFGLYVPIITTLKELLSFNFNNLWMIIIFGFGVIAGIVVSLRGIKKLLDNHRCAVMYTILGMMLGSFYAIINGPTTLKAPQHMMGFSDFNYIWFIVGSAAVFMLSLFKSKMRKQKGDDTFGLNSKH